MEHKRLLVFPVIMIPVNLLALLFFIAPLAVWNTGYACFELEHWKAVCTLFGIQYSPETANQAYTPLAYGYAAAIYLVSMFIATFFNVAFYNEILQALNGNTVSIRRGFGLAMAKWRAILTWSLLSGLVGVLIRAIEERLSFVGRWIVGLIGVAWSVASVFAIPVIIRDEKASNPLNCLRSSAVLLKKTWGEAAIGYLGLQIGHVSLLLGSLVLLGGATAVSVMLNNYWIIAGTGVLWLVTMIVAVYLLGVANHVYRAALFSYASEGVIPAAYDREMMDMAWKIK
jgi:hypothetical protein